MPTSIPARQRVPVVVHAGALVIGIVVVPATAFPASAKEQFRLNSDQITQRFGSYAVEVLSQDKSRRLANLYSKHGNQRICRTLAMTQFELPVAPQLVEADHAIRTGASIGATLRAAGWEVVKSDTAFATATAGKQFVRLGSETVHEGQVLALRVYSLKVRKGIMQLPYAVIAEAYHPEHIPADQDWQQHATSVATVVEGLSGIRGEALSALVSALN